MANFNLNLKVEFGQLFITPSTIEPENGDTVTFIYTENDSASVIEIIPPSSLFTVTSTIILNGVGDSVTRTITNNAIGSYDFSNLTTPPLSFSGFKIELSTVDDDTPNQFYFLPQSNLELNTQYDSNLITVTGINVPITASISGGGSSFNVNGGSFSSSNKTVSTGDTIRLRMTSSSTYDSSKTATLNLNGVTGSWNITTKKEPISLLIPFGKTNTPINFSDVREFFGIGHASQSWHRLRQYLKGGDLVPDIPQNNQIPSSGTINLTDFLGSYHQAFWENTSVFRNADVNPLIVQEHTFYWHLNSTGDPEGNPFIGYGLARRLLQFRWRFRPSSTPPNVTYEGRFGAAGNETGTLSQNTWSSWGDFGVRDGFILDIFFTPNTAGAALGVVDIQIRQKNNTSNVLESQMFTYSLIIDTAILFD